MIATHTFAATRLTESEFRRLAIEQMDMLYRLAIRITRNSAAAEDLVQETYLHAIRAFEGFGLREFGIGPWLVRILRNVHANQLERQKVREAAIVRRARELAIFQDLAPRPVASTDPQIFEAMDQRLKHALVKLPLHYQTPLLLWAVDRLSYTDIATALDIPLGTVMSRLHRARNQLRGALRDLAAEFGIDSKAERSGREDQLLVACKNGR